MADQRENPFLVKKKDAAKVLHDSNMNIAKKSLIEGFTKHKLRKSIMTGVTVMTVTSLIAIPANAVPLHEEEGLLNIVETQPISTFVTPEYEESVELHDILAEIPTELSAEAVRQQQEAEAAAKAKAEEEARVAAERAEQERRSAQAAQQSRDIPQATGAGRTDIANAAASQIGVMQDCTDLVQNALAAVGINATRANGGYDFGTQAHEYTRFGGQIVNDGYLPGDVLVWPGTHVAIYFGDGQIVHGGWGGNQTVINDYMPSPNPIVVRF